MKRKNWIVYWRGVKLADSRRKCPMCLRWHRWPTEDKLCHSCEGKWAEFSSKILAGGFTADSFSVRPFKGRWRVWNSSRKMWWSAIRHSTQALARVEADKFMLGLKSSTGEVNG